LILVEAARFQMSIHRNADITYFLCACYVNRLFAYWM